MAIYVDPPVPTTDAVAAMATTATVTLANDLDGVQTLTPVQAMTINAGSQIAGQHLYIVITTSGTTAFTLTFSTNFKTTGTLSTGTVSAKVFTMHFISDGTNFNEVSRTTAM